MNVRGFTTILRKETRRFLQVAGHSIGQPLVTTSLYFLIFGVALGHRLSGFDGVSYARYLVPGLVALALVQNAFVNTSSYVFLMKTQGTLLDLLVAPLGWFELLAAFSVAAIARALIVGVLTWIVASLFAGWDVAHPVWAAVFAVLIAGVFAMLGLVVAIASRRFEHLNIAPTYIITPLTFLGGVFFSVADLPAFWRGVCTVNPIVYMVDGMRFALLDVHGELVGRDLLVTAGCFGVVFAIAAVMLRSGFRLRT